MPDKNQFKNPRARHTGGSLMGKDKELVEEMNSIRQERNIEEPKTHSLTILPSHIEKIRDYVHFQKMNGDPYYTQGEMLQEAIDMFINSLGFEVPARPEKVRLSERKRSGRKRKGTMPRGNDFTI